MQTALHCCFVFRKSMAIGHEFTLYQHSILGSVGSLALFSPRLNHLFIIFSACSPESNTSSSQQQFLLFLHSLLYFPDPAVVFFLPPIPAWWPIHLAANHFHFLRSSFQLVPRRLFFLKIPTSSFFKCLSPAPLRYRPDKARSRRRNWKLKENMHLNILQLFSGSLNWVFQTLWDEHVPNFILMEQLETNIIRDGSSAAP